MKIWKESIFLNSREIRDQKIKVGDLTVKIIFEGQQIISASNKRVIYYLHLYKNFVQVLKTSIVKWIKNNDTMIRLLFKKKFKKIYLNLSLEKELH